MSEEEDDVPESDANDDPANGRLCSFGRMKVSVSGGSLSISADTTTSSESFDFTMNLRERGWYVESVHEPIVAARSLQYEVRRKKQAEYDEAVARIAELQDERKQLSTSEPKIALQKKSTNGSMPRI